MNLEFVIDNRERALIKKLESNNVKIVVEQLEVGDILFRCKEEVILIIERKTVEDLKASICDGRGREQKARLIGTVNKNRIIYLIEGSLNKALTEKVNGLPISTLVGSLINTQLRDGIKVYKTSSVEESCDFLKKLYDKLDKDRDKYFNEEESKISCADYAYTLKKNKKANMTPEVWLIAQLSLIPQVTEKVAKVIVEKYNNVKDLVIEYEKTPEHLREKLLSDITFQLNSGKERRIGDKISSRICLFFYGKLV